MSKNKRGTFRLPPLRLPLRTLDNSNTFSPVLNSTGILKMNSPMTSLAFNLSELSTGRGTPRRKLSLSSLDTPPTSSCHPTPERLSSTESGCFVDSPTPVDSPTLEMSMHRFAKNIKPDIPPEAFTKKKTIAFRRLQSYPLPMMRLSPVDFSTDKENSIKMPLSFEDDDAIDQRLGEVESGLHQPKFYHDETSSSQDSGVSFDRDREDSHDMGFQFAAPIGVPPRNKMKIINEDTCSPLKYSPVKTENFSPSRPRSNSAPVVTGLDFSGGKIVPPCFEESDSPLKFNPLTSQDDDEDVDDGFLDCMDGEVAEITSPGVSDTMATLFKAPVINQDRLTSKPDEETPVSRRSTSRLFHRSQSFDVRCRLSSKRDPPEDVTTPIQNKRRKSCISSEDEESYSSEITTLPKPKLVRCHSESEALIKSALARSALEPDLIADCSMTYCLPTIPGKHSDLKCISCDTMSKVLNKEYNHLIESCTIVDCRYPYEYDGGHIQGAKNLYTPESIIEEFMKKAVSTEHSETRRNILVFHCEFSSERGPKLLKYLRKIDRDTNKECYPALYYPEIYLLEGGYKIFYEQCKELCEPVSYKPMLHKDHSNDLRHFRAKSKSWAGEKANRPGLRPLKF